MFTLSLWDAHIWKGPHVQNSCLSTGYPPDAGSVRWVFKLLHPLQLGISLSSVSTTMEAIGDITASAEVSRLKVTGDDFDSRIQGGVLVSVTFISR